MKKNTPHPLPPLLDVETTIFLIRNRKAILSHDLAQLYGVAPKVLVQSVKRNIERFPDDFMFQLSADECNNLKSQIVTSSWGGGLRRSRPYAFTEQGVAMLSGILRSPRAIQVNIEIMRTFVRLRRLITTHKDLSDHILKLEKKYDAQFKVVFDAIRRLIEPPPSRQKKPIGFMRS